ncbi:ribonuclease P protein subunit [Candidatus Micrarchaeota archaeon]|nr:ribonuclease P protein subunit [Candidatus Micrarchaeota archaeon]
MITSKNLLFSTFIGLPVEIVNSSQRNLIGIKGIIVDETKNLIVIEREDKPDREIKIPKVSSVFRFTLENNGNKEKIDVDGASITFRPHERPKKV